MKFPRYVLGWLVLTVLMIACHSQPSDVVRKTIQTYRVGVTTFAGFKKDAGLEKAKPLADKQTNHSYLDPELDAMEAKMSSAMPLYTIAEKSPWKLLEEGRESSSESRTTSGFLSGKPASSSSQSSQTKFAVGDAKGPVCILIFDNSDRLAAIKPLP